MITMLPVKSLITYPQEKMQLRPGLISITGVAYGGQGEIARVEVSTDLGRHWRSAELGHDTAPHAWRLWQYDWHAKQAGAYLLMVRAYDSSDQTQPVEPFWNPDGALWNVIDRIRVSVSYPIHKENAMIPATTTRVQDNTDEAMNERIRQQPERNVLYFSGKGGSEIDRRLEELDREWDVERLLETNAASLALLGLGLGVFVDRRFFMLPAIVTGFLLQHALQGWCPPIPVFRRMGIRTASEIDVERYALKVVRGDFVNLANKNGELGEGEIGAIVEAVTR